MSVVFSGTNQGSFTSTGVAKILQIRSDVDWMMVYNYTQAATTQATGRGVQFYWQRGMAVDTGLEYKKTNSTDALNMVALASGGFTLINNTVNVPGAAIALTAVSNATPPVVATGSTAGLNNGDIVRLYNVTGGQQLGGIDFTVGAVTANTSFTLAYMRAIVAATTGTWRRIPFNPYYYPQSRVITKLSAASQAIVTFSVTHAFTVGQKIRFIIPTVTAAAYGMTLLNQVEATIVAINAADADGITNTITVDVDTSAMTAFAWPLTADPVHSVAQVIPVGENTAQAISSGSDILGDSELNQGYIGMQLAAGAQAPAGSNGDVIYWVAGKSFNV